MALGDLLIYVGVAIFCGAFGVVIFLQFRLRHFVSKEKVHAVEDVSQLWKFCVPPKIVLNEKGRRLYRYGWLLLVICLLGIGIDLFVANYSTPKRPYNLLLAILGGAALAGTFLEARLKRHVSKAKVHAVEDVSRLWKFGVPPKIVLSEKGLRLYQYIRLSFVIFLIGVGIMLFGAIYRQ